MCFLCRWHVISRQSCGHRFAYDHDQRPRNHRLGRRRNRGRSGNARSIRVHVSATGHRISFDRAAFAYLHRNRPGANCYRGIFHLLRFQLKANQRSRNRFFEKKMWSASSSNSSDPVWQACRLLIGPRLPTCVPNTAQPSDSLLPTKSHSSTCARQACLQCGEFRGSYLI